MPKKLLISHGENGQKPLSHARFSILIPGTTDPGEHEKLKNALGF
jgi:hypothetical protein